MAGLRRRLTTFWERALVSRTTRPSGVRPYHIATRCGNPPGPMVATVAVRDCRRNDPTSSSVIRICARWLTPMDRMLPALAASG